jgi:hypothetical protein
LSGRIDGRLSAFYADGSLQFAGVTLGKFSVVVQIVVRLVHTVKILSIGKGQELVRTVTKALVGFQGGSIFGESTSSNQGAGLTQSQAR